MTMYNIHVFADYQPGDLMAIFCYDGNVLMWKLNYSLVHPDCPESPSNSCLINTQSALALCWSSVGPAL